MNSKSEMRIVMDNGNLKKLSRKDGRQKRRIAERKMWIFSCGIKREKLILNKMRGVK